MTKITKMLNVVAAIAILMGVNAGAQAQTVATYGNIAAPGVYFGTGNVNGNFTIGTANGIEVALRAKNYGGATIDGSSGVYQTMPGSSPLNAARAMWNYEFSVNTGTNTLGDYIFMLGVDNDPTAAKNYTFVDAATYWSDNARMGNGFQNSQNVNFGSTPGGRFDIFASGSYSFMLGAFGAGDSGFRNPLVQTEILVQVGEAVAEVPEPATTALFGLGLLGLGLMRRRKAK